MPRPLITARFDRSKWLQLNEVLDWLEANGGGGGGGSNGSIEFDDGTPDEEGAFIIDEGTL